MGTDQPPGHALKKGQPYSEGRSNIGTKNQCFIEVGQTTTENVGQHIETFLEAGELEEA